MKNKLYTIAIVAGMAVASSINATANTSFSYGSSIGGSPATASSISFDGSSHFSFVADGSGNDIQIGSGSALGDNGIMTGTYTIGLVSTVGTVSTALVTGTGLLQINDGLGHILQGNLVWVDITQSGTGSTLNLSGQVNLTGITYTGSNADLVALTLSGGNGSASDSLAFTFSPAQTLAQLVGSAHTTTFAGTISTIPDGGATVMLLGAALSAMGLLRRKLMA